MVIIRKITYIGKLIKSVYIVLHEYGYEIAYSCKIKTQVSSGAKAGGTNQYIKFT